MLKAGTMFTGIGGADLGLKAAGFDVVYGIDSNQGALDILTANHDIPIVLHENVCNIDYSTLPEVDLLWASPICTNISNANHNRGETHEDLALAHAIATAARYAGAVIIENVPQYAKTESYQILQRRLLSMGFGGYRELTLNAERFGNPSSRPRFYAIYGSNISWDFLDNLRCQTNWFSVLIKHVDRWERSKLTKVQETRLSREGSARWLYPHEPFAIERCGYYKEPKIVNASDVFPCLKSHVGHDGKNPKPGYGKIGSYRRQYDFVHEGQSYALTPELMGVLMGFPIDYKWGDNKAQAVAGIGNACAVGMVKIIANLIVEQPK